MKEPKDMTRQELVEALYILEIEMMRNGRKHVSRMLREAANRLRNSIDRPTIEAVCDEGTDAFILWRLLVNGRTVFAVGPGLGNHYARLGLNPEAEYLRAALGMEGGEG